MEHVFVGVRIFEINVIKGKGFKFRNCSAAARFLGLDAKEFKQSSHSVRNSPKGVKRKQSDIAKGMGNPARKADVKCHVTNTDSATDGFGNDVNDEYDLTAAAE